MPGANMGEQRRRRGHGQPVGAVGAGIDAQLRQAWPHGCNGHPLRAREDQQGIIGAVENLPALGRIVKAPGAILKGGDFGAVAGPGAGGPRRNDPRLARQGRDRRRRQCGGFHRGLHQSIEPVERVIVGDVLEGLPGHDEG